MYCGAGAVLSCGSAGALRWIFLVALTLLHAHRVLGQCGFLHSLATHMGRVRKLLSAQVNGPRRLPRARVWCWGWGLRPPWRLVLAGVMQVLWQPLEHSVCVPEPLGWTWRMPRGWEAALLRAEARSPPHQGRWLRRLPGWLSEPGLGLG